MIPVILESIGQVLIPVRINDGLVWDLLKNVMGVFETSIHCFMGIEMVTQTLPLKLNKVTSFIAAVVYLNSRHLVCH